MCIGVPCQCWLSVKIFYQLAQVEVCGIKRDVNIALICEGNPADLLGQWVLVHVGFAMSIIDEDEAKATLDALRQMDYDITSA
ncbi:hydrogenase maturation factor HybG [Escherichia coli]|nr:hydrogenase maturation factor HybG [Escherichia coli]